MSKNSYLCMYKIQETSLIVEESSKFLKRNKAEENQVLKELDPNTSYSGEKNNYYTNIDETSTEEVKNPSSIPESLILSENKLYEIKERNKENESRKKPAIDQPIRSNLVKYIHKDKKTIIYMKIFRNSYIQKKEFEMANLLQDIEGIVKIYGNQEFGTSPIVLLEAGQCDLNDLLRIRKKYKKFYSEPEAIYILKTLTNIFAQIHKKQVIHSDIKPHNIIYDNGRYLVIDFELSHKINEEWKQPGNTPFYAAPEILIENVVSDQSTDVYSLGIMIIELLGIEIPKISENFKSEDYKVRATKILEILDKLKQFPILISILKQMVCIEPKRRSSMKKIHDDLEECKQCEQPDESIFIKEIQEKEIPIYDDAIFPNKKCLDSQKEKNFPLETLQKNDKKIFENIYRMHEIINKQNASIIAQLLKKTFNKHQENIDLYIGIYGLYLNEDYEKIEKILKEKNESSEELEIVNKIMIKIFLLCFVVINNRSNDEKKKYENELNLAFKQYKKKFIFTNFFRLNLTRCHTKTTLDLDKQDLVYNMKSVPKDEKYLDILEKIYKLNGLLCNNSALASKIAQLSNLDLKAVFEFLIFVFSYERFSASGQKKKIFEIIFIEGIIDFKKAEHEQKYLAKFEISKKEFLLLYSRKRMKHLLSRNIFTHGFLPLIHDNYFIASAYLSYGELCLEYGKYEEKYRKEVDPCFQKFSNLILYLMRKNEDVVKNINERLNKILKNANHFTYSELKDPSILIAKIEYLKKEWELIQRKDISLLEKKIEIDDKMQNEEEYIYFLLKRCIFYELYLDSNPFFEYLLQKNKFVKFIDETLSCENYCYAFDCWKYLFTNKKIALLSISFENILTKHNSLQFTFFSLAYYIKYTDSQEIFRDLCFNFAFNSDISDQKKPKLQQEMEEFIERFLIQ